MITTSTAPDAPAGYEAARSSAAFFPIQDGGRFRMIGSEAQEFLHRMVTNDIRSLTPGHGAYAAMLDISGRMIADLWAWLLDTDSILVETSAAAHESLMAALDKFLIMEDVEMENASQRLALVSVQGPRALDMAAAALGRPIPALSSGDVWETTGDAETLTVAARDRTGQGGVDVYVATERRDWLINALRRAGVEEGAPETLDTLGLEAGIALWGTELNASVIPLEANLEGVALSFTKGCYPGQEIIARIHSRGKPAKHLVGIRFTAEPPPPGTPVERAGQAVGTVTRSGVSPTLGALAMAYLKKESGEPGLDVVSGGTPGVTTALPFTQAA